MGLWQLILDRPMRFLVGLLLLALTLSGCASGDGADETEQGYTVITDPTLNRTSTDQGLHLHDYWNRQKTLTIADADVDAGRTWFSPDALSVATLRPEAGNVVPQGTGWVNVTVSWTADSSSLPPNRYESPQLWVKSAADNALILRANLTESPTTVAMPVNDSMADLPHQVLSAWQFDLYLTGTPSPIYGRWLQFTGTVHFTVVADHTRNITLFAGHPDVWQGRTEFQLFEAEGSLLYDGDPTSENLRCYRGCPSIHVPDDGVVVPYDADHVVVILTQTNGPPFRLGLKLHGADSRDYTAPPAAPDTAAQHTYTVAVGDAGDGPYAKQSQWEFAPFIEEPMEDGIIFVDYTIVATVHKDAA